MSAVTVSYAPPGESANDLWEERSNFQGLTLSCVAYGVHFTLFLIVLNHFIRHPTGSRAGNSGSSRRKRVSWGLVAYICWNFFLGTIGIAAEASFNQKTFIDDRNFPGGPNAFVQLMYGDFVNIFGTAAYVVLNWFADGMVIYRFWLLYNFNYYVLIFPALMLMGSVAMGSILLFQLTQPGASLWTVTTVNFGIPYWSLSASLNIIVTTLIVLRLLYIRYRTRQTLGSQHGKTYISIAAMLVESASLYSFTVLFFIITYAKGSFIQNLVLPVLGQVQAISPLLIMWRVAAGQAWSKETVQTATGGKLSWATSSFFGGERSRTSTMPKFATTSVSRDSTIMPAQIGVTKTTTTTTTYSESPLHSMSFTDDELFVQELKDTLGPHAV